MYDLVQQDMPITELDVWTLHRLVLRRSQPDLAGRYRDAQFWMRGAAHAPPRAALVTNLVADWSTWTTDHPVRRAARFHGRLAAIHPFVDGNWAHGAAGGKSVFGQEEIPVMVKKFPQGGGEFFVRRKSPRQ